jgi:hypothetical protein
LSAQSIFWTAPCIPLSTQTANIPHVSCSSNPRRLSWQPLQYMPRARLHHTSGSRESFQAIWSDILFPSIGTSQHPNQLYPFVVYQPYIIFLTDLETVKGLNDCPKKMYAPICVALFCILHYKQLTDLYCSLEYVEPKVEAMSTSWAPSMNASTNAFIGL